MEQRGAIYLRTRTWIRDSHELFDYEAKDCVIERDFCSNVSTVVVRNSNNIFCIDHRMLAQTKATGMEYPEYDHLLNIRPDGFNTFSIIPPDRLIGINNSHLIPKRLWLVVGNIPKKRYALKEHDIIRLGRFRLRVKQIITENHQDANFDELSMMETVNELFTPLKSLPENLLSNSSMSSIDPSPSQSNDASTQGFSEDYLEKHPSDDIHTETDPTTDAPNRQCRICLIEGETPDNNLLCVCQCKGTIKYVHLGCLRRWLHSKWIKSNSDKPNSIFVREIPCELCKTKYPSKILHDGKTIQVFTLPKMNLPILILENITPYAVKGYHIVSMDNIKEFKLGRGNDSDLRIPDVSISRYHATITYDNGTFYLQDHDSKFGTLVAITRSFVIKPTGTLFVNLDNLTFQIGRSVIDASIGKGINNINGVLELIKECKPTENIHPNNDILPAKNIVRNNTLGHTYTNLGPDATAPHIYNINNRGDNNITVPASTQHDIDPLNNNPQNIINN